MVQETAASDQQFTIWAEKHPDVFSPTAALFISILECDSFFNWISIQNSSQRQAVFSITPIDSRIFLQQRKELKLFFPRDSNWKHGTLTSSFNIWWKTTAIMTLYRYLNCKKKAILLRCIATMWRPRSDISALQARDIEFSYINKWSSTTQIVTGITLHIHQPKENQSKVTKLGTISLSHLCPVRTTFEFMNKTWSLRSKLPADHTLFLANIAQPEKIKSVSPVTAANIVKRNMKAAGINTNIYGPHTLRSASSTKAFQLGTGIQKIKQYAH